MSWIIKLTLPARGQLTAIRDRRIKESIEKRIQRLEHDPEKQGKSLGKDLASYRSVEAVGQRYRIVYKLEAERVVVVVVTVGIRKEGDKNDVYVVTKKMLNLGLLDFDIE